MKIPDLFFIICGHIFLVIGVAGIFLPVLPGTIFLLLSAACYFQGSKKFYNWLLNHKFLGKYVKPYREGRGIPLKLKIFSLLILWIGIGISIWLFKKNILTLIILFIILTISTIYLLKQKTF